MNLKLLAALLLFLHLHPVHAGKSQDVSFAHWGGSLQINKYISNWSAQELKKDNINLIPLKVNDTQDVVTKLLGEKRAGLKKGSLDLVWVNGENFSLLKKAGLLRKIKSEKLKNYNAYFDADNPQFLKDFGVTTDHFETPWGMSHFVFVYNTAKVPNPPKTMQQLEAWVKKNPGRFTYPAPPDFTGSAFLRHIFHGNSKDYHNYTQPRPKSSLKKSLHGTWQYLNRIKPYLWKKGKVYPKDLAMLNKLYASEEVWLTMGYSPSTAESKVKKGLFPQSTRTFVFETGTLANTHFLAIPFNAPHYEQALKVIDFFQSPKAQIEKYKPEVWGDLPAIAFSKLPQEDKKKMRSVDPGLTVLNSQQLEGKSIVELEASHIPVMERLWKKKVARGQ